MITPAATPVSVLEPGENFRWFGRTPDGRRSSSWGLWVARNSADVYLVNRALGGQIKVSLHASGHSQVSFLNRDIAAEWLDDPGADRHLDVWGRRPEIFPGWTRLFDVILPGPEMRHFEEAGVARRRHHVLECPPNGVVHVVLFAVQRDSSSVVVLRGGGAHVAECRIDDQRDLFVVAQLGEWNPTLADAIETERAGGSPMTKTITRPGQSVAPSQITRMPMWGRGIDGGRLVIEAAALPLDATSADA